MLGGAIAFSKVVSDGECGTGSGGDGLELVHNGGDVAVGVFVALPEELVGGIDDDEAVVAVVDVLFELWPQGRDVGAVAAEVPDD